MLHCDDAAFVTPFEVGFLEPEINALFVLNRGIDVIFIYDVYVNLHLAYFDKMRGWVYDPRRCMRRYLRGWFGIDVVSAVESSD